MMKSAIKMSMNVQNYSMVQLQYSTILKKICKNCTQNYVCNCTINFRLLIFLVFCAFTIVIQKYFWVESLEWKECWIFCFVFFRFHFSSFFPYLNMRLVCSLASSRHHWRPSTVQQKKAENDWDIHCTSTCLPATTREYAFWKGMTQFPARAHYSADGGTTHASLILSSSSSSSRNSTHFPLLIHLPQHYCTVEVQ